jgi:hypothetical protein
MSTFRYASQFKATMLDLPAGPLASLPEAPPAAFQPETAWMPPDHVMPAPAAANNDHSQDLMAVAGRRVFSCSASKACTPYY